MQKGKLLKISENEFIFVPLISFVGLFLQIKCYNHYFVSPLLIFPDLCENQSKSEHIVIRIEINLEI